MEAHLPWRLLKWTKEIDLTINTRGKKGPLKCERAIERSRWICILPSVSIKSFSRIVFYLFNLEPVLQITFIGSEDKILPDTTLILKKVREAAWQWNSYHVQHHQFYGSAQCQSFFYLFIYLLNSILILNQHACLTSSFFNNFLGLYMVRQLRVLNQFNVNNTKEGQ